MNYAELDFLNDIVTPYFMGSIKKDVFSVVYDLNGKVFLCTNQFAKMLGYNIWQDLKGKSIEDFAIQMPQCEPDFYRNLETIRQRVITENINAQYINFLYNSRGITSQMVHHFPIFMPNGEVVASRVIANDFNIVDTGINKFMDYVKKNKTKLLTTSDDSRIVKHSDIDLTDREYSIVFLVAARLNLEEISIFLDLPVSRVISVLEGPICHKFGLSIMDFVLLRQIVLDSSIIDRLPRKFMKPRSIIIHNTKYEDTEIVTKS